MKLNVDALCGVLSSFPVWDSVQKDADNPTLSFLLIFIRFDLVKFWVSPMSVQRFFWPLRALQTRAPDFGASLTRLILWVTNIRKEVSFWKRVDQDGRGHLKFKFFLFESHLERPVWFHSCHPNLEAPFLLVPYQFNGTQTDLVKTISVQRMLLQKEERPAEQESHHKSLKSLQRPLRILLDDHRRRSKRLLTFDASLIVHCIWSWQWVNE